MTIHLYHCPTAPAHRRWIAQFARIKDNFYITVLADTADNARGKAEVMVDYQKVPLIERRNFDLKGRLAVFGGASVEEDEFEDLL